MLMLVEGEGAWLCPGVAQPGFGLRAILACLSLCLCLWVWLCPGAAQPGCGLGALLACLCRDSEGHVQAAAQQRHP
eukprot:1154237-Pelagomonas_calceolata.AAC.3